MPGIKQRKARIFRTRPSRTKRKATNNDRAIIKHRRGFTSKQKAKAAIVRGKINRRRRTAERRRRSQKRDRLQKEK